MGACTVIVWPPLKPLVGPVVVPVGPGGQINLPAGRALLRDRGHQEGRAKHVFVAEVGHFGVVGKIQRQGAQEGRSGEPGLVAERIDVGHELVAQAQVLLQNRLGLLAVGPDLVVPPAAVGAQDGQEGGVLEPARVKLRVIVVAADIGARIGGIEQRRVRRMVLCGQILPAAGVVGPVSRCPRRQNRARWESGA